MNAKELSSEVLERKREISGVIGSKQNGEKKSDGDKKDGANGKKTPKKPKRN